MRRIIYLKGIFHLLVTGFLVAAIGCSGEQGQQSAEKRAAAALAEAKQVNICIFLDLSDRIEPSIHASVPSHKERDIEAVLTVVNYFRDEMKARGAFSQKEN